MNLPVRVSLVLALAIILGALPAAAQRVGNIAQWKKRVLDPATIDHWGPVNMAARAAATDVSLPYWRDVVTAASQLTATLFAPGPSNSALGRLSSIEAVGCTYQRKTRCKHRAPCTVPTSSSLRSNQRRTFPPGHCTRQRAGTGGVGRTRAP